MWLLPDNTLIDAACKEAEPSLFEVTQPRYALPAVAYCQRCPVKAACLASRPEQAYGVWGGAVWSGGSLGRDRGRPTRLKETA